MSPPEDKLEAAKRAEEEKMELERGEKLLDTSIDESSQDGKRNRVDSLSSHFIKVGLGSSEVFEPEASNHPPPPSTAPLSSAVTGLPHSYLMARTARRNMMSASLSGAGPFSR